MIFLTSYRPLVLYRDREAIERCGLPPFVDSSCRREPDLESVFPAISAICRGKNFAPRLREGNIVVYMTVKANYQKAFDHSHNCVTAVLRVLKTFESHAKAAAWYTGHGQPLPSNCLVKGNPPLLLDKTAGFYVASGPGGGKFRKYPHDGSEADLIAEWDIQYRGRAMKNPQMVATERLYVNLTDPVAISAEDAKYKIFKERGRMPITQTPPSISVTECRRLMKFCNTGVVIRDSDGKPNKNLHAFSPKGVPRMQDAKN